MVVVGGGAGEVVGVVIGGAVGCVTGVGGWVTGVGAAVGTVTLECAPCVVCVVGGCVVLAPGEVVDVAAPAPAAGVTAAVGIPLFSTANHTPPTSCPCACPFFLSAAKRYSGRLW